MENSVTLLLDIKPDVSKRLGEVFAKVVHDLRSTLLQDLGINFFTSADRPVDGTENAVLGYRIDPEAFDLQLRAALRAKGFTL